MNEIFIDPDKSKWQDILQRPVFDHKLLEEKVYAILQDVKLNGDAAIKKYTKQFDTVDLDQLLVSTNEIAEAVVEITRLPTSTSAT